MLQLTQDFGFQREVNDTCPKSALSLVLILRCSSSVCNDKISTNLLNDVPRLASGGGDAVFRHEASLQRQQRRFVVGVSVKATNLQDIGKRALTEFRTGNDFVPIKGTHVNLVALAAIGPFFFFFFKHNVMDSTVPCLFYVR
jgi:hypothetical protein